MADQFDPDDAQKACFEAGIKFGSLYHQFVGTPVSPGSAPALARAIESSIENQPHCRAVDVAIDVETLEAAVAAGPAEYVEFTGRFFEATVHVEYESTTVVARMALDDGYPLMGLERVESG